MIVATNHQFSSHFEIDERPNKRGIGQTQVSKWHDVPFIHRDSMGHLSSFSGELVASI